MFTVLIKVIFGENKLLLCKYAVTNYDANQLRKLYFTISVFVIFCNSDMLRDILYRAYHLGMANGDYVFITMELFPSDWLGYYTRFLRG